MHVAAGDQIWNVLAEMSEFKYACPVCSQHIKCDSSQAGTRMTCPTCFQEIIVPQAPASEHQTLIISGIKAGDRPQAKSPELNPYAAPAEKRISGVVVVLVIFLLIGLAVGFVYRTTIIEPLLEGKNHTPPKPASQATNAGPGAGITNAANPPMADDTNWVLDLAKATIPDSVAAGRIHGQDFQVERAVFSHGYLVLRAEDGGPVFFGVTINFNRAQAAALAGKNLNIQADTNKSARVTLHWEEDSGPHEDSYDINYALRLQFGSLTNRHLPGHIYLCTPDPQKSYLMGAFNAEVHVPKNQPK